MQIQTLEDRSSTSRSSAHRRGRKSAATPRPWCQMPLMPASRPLIFGRGRLSERGPQPTLYYDSRSAERVLADDGLVAVRPRRDYVDRHADQGLQPLEIAAG